MADRTNGTLVGSPDVAFLDRLRLDVAPDYLVGGDAEPHINAAGAALLELCEEVTRAVELLEQSHVGAWWAGFFSSRPWLESLTVELSMLRSYDALGNDIYNEHVDVEAVTCSAEALGADATLPVDDDSGSLREAISPICEATLESLRPHLGCRYAVLSLQRRSFEDALRAHGSGCLAFEAVRASARVGAQAANTGT